jgi:hypothetical protein
VRSLVALIAVGLCLAFAAPASADQPDSHAPVGAKPDWLPGTEWVMERWLPFNEKRLEQVYGMDRPGLYFYLKDGDQSLLDLAREKSIPTRGLAVRLLATRHGLKPSQRRSLTRRTRDVLGQGHLAEHMLGHAFHEWAIWAHTKEIFGLTELQYNGLAGMTQVERAAKGGVTPAQLRGRVIAALARSRQRGVARKAISLAEARTMRAQALEAIDRWLVAPQMMAGQPSASASLLCHIP